MITGRNPTQPHAIGFLKEVAEEAEVEEQFAELIGAPTIRTGNGGRHRGLNVILLIMIYEQAFGILILGLKLGPAGQPVFANFVILQEVEIARSAQDGRLSHAPDINPRDIRLLIRGQRRASVHLINPSGVEIIVIGANHPRERLEISGEETDRMRAVIRQVTVKGEYVTIARAMKNQIVVADDSGPGHRLVLAIGRGDGHNGLEFE